IDNDGNFSALAEKLHYPHIQDLGVLTIDDVISSGVIAHNQLVHGARGYANSMAHHIINFDGRDCICGQKGCLETYISHRALLKEINTVLPVSDIDHLITLAKEDQPDVLALLERFTRYLAAGLTNLIYILDCELIVINSKIIAEMPELLEQTQAHIVLPITKSQAMTYSKIGEIAPLLGAATLTSNCFYKNILLF
ncbi:MAG: ROK family protein, partial [Cellulosilyticaceae bacterium]